MANTPGREIRSELSSNSRLTLATTTGTSVAKSSRMADLDATNVMRIAREVTLEQSLPVKVAGVVPGGGEGDYVDILITIDGCPCEPCQFAIGAFRGESEGALRDELGVHLRKYLDDYRAVHMRRSA